MNKTICGFLILSGSVAIHAQERPNFVLIIADDVSRDDIGCYGNSQVKTPNIDRLAASGLKFNNMFLTASSSSPSRNSIITGRYPHNTGGAELHTEPPDFMVSFAEILRKSGYYSAQAGKFHMGPYARRGFDKINDNGKLIGNGGEELWVKCLKERPPGKPFFMWFAAMDSHRQWGPNEFSGKHNPVGIVPPFYLAQGEKTRNDLARYYDEIYRFDNYVGLVYDELVEQGVAGNTLIIIMADNGRPFPHSKTRVNDRGLLSPFIIHWPDGIGRNPRECNALVSSIDIAPTLLELASASIPETVQGKSFTTLLKNPGGKFRNFVFAEHNWHDYEAHVRMVRTTDFLFILNSRPQFPQSGPADAVGSPSYEELDSLWRKKAISLQQSDVFTAPRPREELYDNNADPNQFNNIATLPGNAIKVKELREVLEEWMEKTGDNIPVNLTGDWYERQPGYIKTRNMNIRGEPVDKKFDAVRNNNKGNF